MARSPRHVAEVPEADVAMSVHRSAEHNRPTLRLAYMNWGLLNGAKSPTMIVLAISGLSTASPSQRRSSGRGAGADQSRDVTSWTSHVLPSGSVKHENDL